MKKLLIKTCIIGLISWFGLHFSGCVGDTINPCENKRQIGGSFTMGEHITNYGGVDTLLVSDTVITDNVVLFRADSTYSSYEWKIGDDPRVFTTKEVGLMFRSPESNIPVRLIARWRADKECFPEDVGVDTVYKYLTVIDKRDNPIFGTYIGALVTNPTHSYEVEISTDLWFDTFYLKNINEGCEMSNNHLGIRLAYKAISFSEDSSTQIYINGCKNPKGWLFLSSTGYELVGNYSVGNGSQLMLETVRTKEKFVGQKNN